MADAQGAQRRQSRIRDMLAGWRAHHGEVARNSFQRLLATPVSSAMTWLVIGIALALPASLYVGLINMQALGEAWDSTARLSLYLKMDVDDARGKALAEALRKDSELVAVQFTDRASALAEFRAISGFGDVLDGLDENPLPALITVEPVAGLSAEHLGQLQQRLSALPEVESAQLDLEWVQRLYALVKLGQRLAITLAALLALGVILVIGNTIRLAIESRRDEIVVIKLVGGTDAFVRRPFLYTGLWYGVGGGLCAWLVVAISLWVMSGPVARLAGLYGSEFSLDGLGLVATLLLWLSGGLLGLAGAWLAVARHLGDIEPK
ncbi:MAG: cell division protein FtsX [Gammaproteobacteria bacterium]|nr:MAG: cell division protein FtsX [Gammaproteobacteria bacterium]